MLYVLPKCVPNSQKDTREAEKLKHKILTFILFADLTSMNWDRSTYMRQQLFPEEA